MMANSGISGSIATFFTISGHVFRPCTLCENKCECSSQENVLHVEAPYRTIHSQKIGATDFLVCGYEKKRICIHAETLMTIFAKIPLFTIIIAIFLNRNRTTMRTANNGNWFIIICKILFQYRINLIVYRMNSIFGNTGYPIDQSGSLSHNRHLNLLYNSILDLILIYMMSFTYLATFMVNLAKIFIK